MRTILDGMKKILLKPVLFTPSGADVYYIVYTERPLPPLPPLPPAMPGVNKSYGSPSQEIQPSGCGRI